MLVVFAMTGVQLKQQTVWIIIIAANVALGMPHAFNHNFRYGIDYGAYIQQAGAVWEGERDYSKISSSVGPCYYPAGHFVLYIPVYLLHKLTINAEIIMKVMHHVINSIAEIYATRIFYMYWTLKTEGEAKNTSIKA